MSEADIILSYTIVIINNNITFLSISLYQLIFWLYSSRKKEKFKVPRQCDYFTLWYYLSWHTKVLVLRREQTNVNKYSIQYQEIEWDEI